MRVTQELRLDVLGLEGRDPEAAIAQKAAEACHEGALARVGGGAEDHQEAGHMNGSEGVQVYLPFGRWDCEGMEDQIYIACALSL